MDSLFLIAVPLCSQKKCDGPWRRFELTDRFLVPRAFRLLTCHVCYRAVELVVDSVVNAACCFYVRAVTETTTATGKLRLEF